MKSLQNYPEVKAPLLPTWFAGKTKEFTEFGATCTVTCTKAEESVPGYPLDWSGTCTIFGHEFTQDFILEPTDRAISEFLLTSIAKVLAIGAAHLAQGKAPSTEQKSSGQCALSN
jgi:hypothetical protein